ncbi:MAG: UTP--glucose-1-phosphate uridylyltransferase [Patescibacteria group bacterium]
MFKVKKAIFVVAGFGTRFLPITKSVPKEMMPIIDKPIIQYLVEEAVQAGIEDIIFVTGRGKNAIENHFDKSYELESTLVEKGKHDLLSNVEKISKLAEFAYVRQPVQHGDGHALLCAKSFIDLDEPVLVVFPDYIMPSSNQTLDKLIKFYGEFGKPVIATDFVPQEKVSKYGIVDYDSSSEGKEIVKVNGFVEKPPIDQAPSNMINNGYAVIDKTVWNHLEQAESTAGDGEIRVADAFVKMTNAGQELYALRAEKSGYDCGTPVGFLKATVDFALNREDLKQEFTQFLENRICQ